MCDDWPASAVSCGGGHFIMDYEDFFVEARPAGEWVLGALRDAVAQAGVREVHHKLVVLGEHGESPPGFTAAVLIDESHVTAHCYSTRGWLALDVFTCGSHDPGVLADDIHRRIACYAPSARRVQHRMVPRFLHHKRPLVSRRDLAVSMAAPEPPEPENGSPGAPQDLRDAYQQRIQAEGGETSFRLSGAVDDARSEVRERLQAAGSALDLDGSKARRGSGGGILDLASWRLTVGFLGVVVLLACFSAATTDFGPGDAPDAPPASSSGPVDRYTSDGGELMFGRRL